jgi:hypothetical protein
VPRAQPRSASDTLSDTLEISGAALAVLRGRRMSGRLLKQLPSDRHEMRMRALYVDLLSDATWSRPGDLPPMLCYQISHGRLR